jgi:predicted nucleotidyltransferase
VSARSIEDEIRAFFERDRRGVIAAWLFGSVARGDAHEGSDIDVAVLFDRTPASTYATPALELQAELPIALGRDVDVVCMNTAPPDLRIRVLREGHLLIDDDRSRRIAFEVQTRNEWFDIEPRLREYRRQRSLSGRD